MIADLANHIFYFLKFCKSMSPIDAILFYYLPPKLSLNVGFCHKVPINQLFISASCKNLPCGKKKKKAYIAELIWLII